MATLQRSPARRIPARTHKAPTRREAARPPAVPAERVREMLLEIAFVLHATRVVRRMDDATARDDALA
jgi:hypothetical protein